MKTLKTFLIPKLTLSWRHALLCFAFLLFFAPTSVAQSFTFSGDSYNNSCPLGSFTISGTASDYISGLQVFGRFYGGLNEYMGLDWNLVGSRSVTLTSPGGKIYILGSGPINVYDGTYFFYFGNSLYGTRTIIFDEPVPAAGEWIINIIGCSQFVYRGISWGITPIFTTSCNTPTITCPGNQIANTDNNTCDAVVSYTATSTGDPAPDVTYSFSGATTSSGNGDGSGSTFNNGTTTVTLTATNDCGSDSCEFTVTVTDNEAPEITCPTPEVSYSADSGICSASLTFDATSTDNCGVASTVYSVDGVAISFPYAFLVGSTTVDVLVTDIHTNTNNCSFDVTVANSAPNNVVITGQATPQPIGSNVDVSATFVDENIDTATWIAFDGSTEVQTSPSYEITGASTSHTFVDLPTGVYTIILKLKDHCDLETVVQWQYAVIYDPNGGFVTGGGWFNSLAGNMPYNPSAEGKANFDFVAKYKTGNNNTNEVDGNTNFQFKEGDFHFKSSSHTAMSLVISGDRKATYKGSGTVNGYGAYDFMVSVIDGEAPGAGPYDYDSFRIKVWQSGSPSSVVYDNEFSLAENADALTRLGGGSIVIHKPKGGNNAREINTESESIEDVFNGFELVTWPNPSKDSFNLKLKSSNSIDSIEIQVFDLNGRKVFSKAGSANQEYNIGSTFQSGLYLVIVNQGNATKQAKLIKY